MKTCTIRAVALTAFVIVGSPAFAGGAAKAVLQNLTISIGQISSQTGAPAPSIQFNAPAGEGSSAYNFETASIPLSSLAQASIMDRPFESNSVSGSIPNAFGTAFVTGDPFQGQGLAHAESHVISVDGARMTSTSAASPTGNSTTFTLGPNTYLDITATAILSADLSVDTGDWYDFSNALAELYVTGINGPTSQSSESYAAAWSESSYGAFSGVPSLSEDLEVTFFGSRTGTTSGIFIAVAASEVDSFNSNTAAVPEPAAAALLLVGLAAMNLSARRRRGA